LLPGGGRYAFTLEHQGRALAEVTLRVPGRHNVLNALAAAALAWHEGLAPVQLAAGLAGFRGLKRRLEHRGVWQGVTMLDDYAHHPTEIAAALDAVRRMFPGRRVWCVFQPHQASRTAHLLDGLAETLQNADNVLVAEIFRAREGPPQPGEVTAADLGARVRIGGTPCPRVHDQAGITAVLRAELSPGDVLVTMGAGDIGRICHELACWPGRDRAAG
jgi:UDP-N-acetylmuramate--alanine ligase